MAEINIKSSIALDIICFLEKRFLNNQQWMRKDQIEIIGQLNAIASGKLSDECLGMSTLSLILSICFEDRDLSQLSLDDLISLFQNPKAIEKAVKSKKLSEFSCSYIYPMLDWLNDGYADEYIRQIDTLKAIGFEAVYNEKVLPSVKREIAALQSKLGHFDFDSLLENISILKKQAVSDVNIIVSFFSYPTAFTLFNNSFLTCFIGDNDPGFLISMIAHELMHGFASDKLTKLYLSKVNSDDYLIQKHKSLIDDFHSGNEEEFVMAAEYYLVVKSGISDRKSMLNYAKKRYSGCCPLSVIIFDYLMNDEKMPCPYNDWLIELFENDQLPKHDIEKYIRTY